MKLLCMAILAAVLVFFSCPALAASTAQVQIKDMKFQPSEVTIQSGGTVAWTNEDPMLHDVKFKDSESPNLKKGEQYSKTFDKPGTYDYLCEIHPGMKGKVIVT
ncbi:copper binding protein [Methanocella paludicola SANAE]|uniref:Copper binding protein n=1 Tax=Methanocella paludicola (strain DSM 17711 / JCM 13418 / NBRC 101707 / SANAE) TaxID=304371 RepID=D1Z2J0_METPS|nr:cupredoxin family copper-binding protein [Methanocella paludicola]BAI62912.1 copper binding protein [Methanocella paludicola SANAE]